MAISMFVFLFPRIHEEVVISFATSALVTGIALITTGFIQGQRQEIAYFQQAIIVQMAGMGFGPDHLCHHYGLLSVLYGRSGVEQRRHH